MNVSAVAGPASSQYADALRSALATRAQNARTASVDNDGDHDGSTAVKGRLDIKM